jgi:HlyD family secretion protein
MNAARRIVLIVVVVLGAAWLGWRAWGPRDDGANVLSGYVEGEVLYLSTPVAGSVVSVSVVRGERVAAGAKLFAVDPAILQAQRDQQVAQLAAARAQIAAAEAKLQQSAANVAGATAQAENATKDLARYRMAQRASLASVSQQQIDQATATAANTAAQRDAARQDVNAQAAQIEMMRAQAAQYQAAIAEAQSRLDQLAPVAPAAGLVQDTYYQVGEWAGANQPIIAFLPDDRVRLRFFVPEHEVARYRPGETVRFSCDGCAAGLQARISYVSAQPEFTPPIIYSRNSRDRLVFLVEAMPSEAKTLMPGLPVDVLPLAAAP